MIEKYACDVLVIGAGAAGIRAAVESCDSGCDVMIAVKGGLCESGSSFYSGTPGWGLCAAVQAGDSPEKHKLEILNLAKGTAKEELTEILTVKAKERIDDLESYGIEFKRNGSGHYLSVKPCFSKTERSVSVRGMDKIRSVFLSQIEKRGIKILEHHPMLGLISENNVCRGAYGVKHGRLIEITAKSVVLATGGGISLFNNSYSIGDLTGDGYSMALDAGARLTNLEFIQFIPATKKPKKGKSFEQRALNYLDTHRSNSTMDEIEKVSGKKVRDVLNARSTHGPFSTRDDGKYFDRVLFDGSGKRKILYFRKDIEKSSNWVAESFANRMKTEGMDLYKIGISLELFAQAFNGGVLIDENAKTSVQGLFACGEAAGGMHGADRMGGCAMASTQVFGRIAGKSAAIHAKAAKSTGNKFDAMKALKQKLSKYSLCEYDIKSLKKTVKSEVTNTCLCLRNEKKCVSALSRLKEYESKSLSHAKFALTKNNYSEVKNALECYNMINAAKAVITMINERKESLGPHYRTDFAKSSSESAMHVLSKINGKMVVGTYD